MGSQARMAMLAAALLVAVLLVGACGTTPIPTPTAAPAPTTAAPATPTPASPGTTPTPPGRDMAAYFSGKTVTLIIGFAPGGGYDVVSRMIARFLPDHLPGNPRVVVQNLPGAAGARGLQATLQSEPNGLTITSIPPLLIAQALAGQGVEGFDPGTAYFVGTPDGAEAPAAAYVRRSVATSWEEVMSRGRDLVHGVTAPGHQGSAGILLLEAVGGPINNVFGYGGTSEILAAMDRGEVDIASTADYATVPRLFPEWIENRFIVPVFRWGPDPSTDPDFVAWMQTIGADMPPHLFDVWPFTEQQTQVFLVLRSVQSNLNRSFVLPAGTPDDIGTAWRQALKATIEDPRYVELAIPAGYAPYYGDPSEADQNIQMARDLLDDPELRSLFAELAGVGGL